MKNFIIWIYANIFSSNLKLQLISFFESEISDETIKEKYRISAKSNLKISSQIIDVKKGKKRYQLLILETKKGIQRFNLSRHLDFRSSAEITGSLL